MREYEVVILGGGPAGLTAGLYSSRYGIKTVLIERGMFGGKIVNARHVENYPGFPLGISGMDLGQQMYEQAMRFGLTVETAEVNAIEMTDGLFIVAADDEKYQTKAVIVATGANDRKLGIDGEKRLTGRGISYCATCDGFLFKNKAVAVVGGGDTALSDALELAEHAGEVYIIHRRDQLRGSEVLQKSVLSNPKIKMVWDTVIEGITGEQKLGVLNLRNKKTDATTELKVDGLFVAVGMVPNSGLVEGLAKLDENGSIITDELMCTSVRGVYAAGDIRRNSARQVVTAVGDGATAAKSAFRYIKGQD
ncbi:MAG: thioredoxin-disulfide reductase [Dehalococcoidia bacterium]|nr:thioredoxin-disulfide reductase [Dehalococcoidia bacterium]